MSVSDIRVISLNIQHGWNLDHSVPPVYMPKATIVENLDRIGSFLLKENADIVLLQEVDRVSPLSRKIDQLEHIKNVAQYPYAAFGSSSEFTLGKRAMYSAGCGILSRHPIRDVENVKFGRSFPVPRKGFLSAKVSVAPGVELTVVSVHLVSLDVTKPKPKEAQLDHLMQALAEEKTMIIGGDLNISLKSRSSKHMHTLMRTLNVATHNVMINDASLNTFPAVKPQKRLDWILASSDLTIKEYRTLHDRVSDHLAVGTTVSL